MGRTPLSVYAPSARTPNHVDEAKLREALAVRERRRVRRDTTISLCGQTYELEHGFLAGRIVDVVYSHLDDPLRPEVEYEGRRYPLHLADPIKNANAHRPLRTPQHSPRKDKVPFDPCSTTLPDDVLDDSVVDLMEENDALF